MTQEELPTKLMYNKDYSWVDVQGDTATIGIIGPSAKKVKEFVFIKLPQKNKDIKKGDNYVSVEAVKWSGHLSSPVSGKIVEVHDALFNEPSLINDDPYGNWIVKVKLSNPDELKELISSEEVNKWLEKNNK